MWIKILEDSVALHETNEENLKAEPVKVPVKSMRPSVLFETSSVQMAALRERWPERLPWFRRPFRFGVRRPENFLEIWLIFFSVAY